MTLGDQARLDRRLLMLPATPKDGAMARDMLWRAGIETELCDDVSVMASELQRGAAAVMLPEESIGLASRLLALVIAQQAPWSDLPVLVLTRQGADSADASLAVSALGNVTLLERPVRVATLVSTVRTALRARERQYQIRRHLAELREADQRKDEFLATLGHELRNPLSPLLTSVELLRLSAPTDPTIGRVVGVMQRQASHLVRLVDDLLEVSRITRGLIEVQGEPLELAEVIAAAVETSRPVIEASAHRLTVEVPSEPLTVLGDSVRLTQVFANLLNNAAKYTDPGGTIELTMRHTRHTAFISVRDTGIGIDREHLSSVFDMFTQVSRSDRRTQGGLGIGLTLVRSLVALHGGSVTASSEGRGRGSTFEVRLPLAVVAEKAPHGTNGRKGFDGWRVLVVDDNQDATDTLQTLLESLGAEVAAAGNGRDALAQFERFEPDAVLLDIGMPGMDGYEVARRIRAMPSGGGTPLIALTGWGQQEDVRRCFEAGFDHHLVKPLDVDKLWEIVAGASSTMH
jgi:signal transduction histidine kinase/CheY-like chemotaxis protein